MSLLQERTEPIHLLLPFSSSVLVVIGLLYLKRAQVRGVSMWTVTIVVCWACAGVFPVLTLMGGTMQPVSLLWQPAIVAVLFLAGQLFMFLAIEQGDVSIAAPVLGIKVLMVPAVAPLFVAEELSARIWVAAAIAVVGIVCVQARDASVQRSRVFASVTFALLAASSMTVFDLLIARWAEAWGTGYFLPLMFGFAGLFSLSFGKLADRPRDLPQMDDVVRPLAIGAILMAVQAAGMTVTLGMFRDATRVNIVYSLRGLWGVLLTWMLARRFAESDTVPSHRTMTLRLIGAVLIGISVVISVT